jgi:hypothetical protein
VEEELDAWTHSHRTAALWWRDDDAVESTPALDRLLGISADLGVSVALAVIPAEVDESLARAIRGREVAILQHGWDHTDHAPVGDYKAELAAGRDPVEVRQQLARGWDRLVPLFEDRLLPVLVPPFNQMAPELAEVVSAAYQFVSIVSDFDALRVRSVNVHCEIVDSKTGAAASEEIVALQLATALKLRRYHLVNARRPIGILTHHLVHTIAEWSLLTSLLTRLRAHKAVSFPPLTEIFNSYGIVRAQSCRGDTAPIGEHGCER